MNPYPSLSVVYCVFVYVQMCMQGGYKWTLVSSLITHHFIYEIGSFAEFGTH